MRRFFADNEEETQDYEPGEEPKPQHDITNGALDTLTSVIRTMGDESFPLDADQDPHMFAGLCHEFVRHIENGEAVPSFDIQRSADGQRQWPQVRNFFSERRRAERSFVTERLGNYRDVVESLITGLRQIGERDQDTERRVQMSFQGVEKAVETGELSRIQESLKKAVSQVSETFSEQQLAYEKQLEELNSRMACLRQDLVAAREEMKRDSLTDAYNRGAFDTAIEQALRMHFVLQQPVTLALIDLDKFKSVNDQHGHSTGDLVLKSFGECLARAFIRKSDLVARFGGDEFAVILNETDGRSASKVIDRFVASVAKMTIPPVTDEKPITCSVGFTTLNEKDTIESAINRADQGLYAVKSRGGNGAEFRAWSDDKSLN